jgi:predicted PurR-regulated permease PerM
VPGNQGYEYYRRKCAETCSQIFANSFFCKCIVIFWKTLFIPIFYGLLIAKVLYPVCKRLEQHKRPRSLSIAPGLSIVVILFAVIPASLALEVNAFRRDFPGLRTKLGSSLLQLRQWPENNFSVSIEAQNKWLQRTLSSLSDNTGIILRGTANMFFVVFLVPEFTALFLYNRCSFVRFLEKIVGNKYDGQLHTIPQSTVHTYFNFIKGMIMVYIIAGILNSIGLLALEIKHAILFGFLTAIMTIIPYIGIFVSALLPISVAWITKDSVWYPIGVVAVFGFVQYPEANVIFPRVVASQLKVSTFATLVAIIAGGILRGVSGMILFIPFAGILKIVADNVTELQSLNILPDRDTMK